MLTVGKSVLEEVGAGKKVNFKTSQKSSVNSFKHGMFYLGLWEAFYDRYPDSVGHTWNGSFCVQLLQHSVSNILREFLSIA